MSFVHLHRHSEWSLLDGVGTAEHYAERAAELGQPALAITDHGTLAGALYHFQACEEAGIKPILGMEGYFRQDIAADRKNGEQYGYFHLVLLAKNQEGFRNLMRLSSLSYQEQNFYQKPNIDWKMLREHSEGLIASTSCASGIIPRAIVEDDSVKAKKLLSLFQNIFKDDFFLEIQPHDFEEQRTVNLALVSMAGAAGMPIVATQDVHYPYEDWAETQDVLLMISTGQSTKKRAEAEAENKEYLQFTGGKFWLTTGDEIAAQFAEIHPHVHEEFVKEAVANSGVIAERCEHFQFDKSPKIPKATRSTLEAERILREWCKEGLDRIGKADDEVYLERIETEFQTLRKLKVLDYFVIVGDMVRWAKDQGIRVGAGRGSAAGCLINYLIGITAVDPIGYGLLFERFMNEYRTELPDIDIDFQDDRREEVKDYLRERWGDDYVVNVASFQSFGPRAVVQDVSRVLDIPYGPVTRATNAIPAKTFGETLEDIESHTPELQTFFKEYPQVREHAMRLSGQMKGLSKHPAAVIVTDKPAADLIPMMRDKKGGTVTQWSERANAQLISPYGFLKIDALSTDGLTNQARAIKLIKERRGVDIDFEDSKQFPVNESPDYAEQDVVEAFSNGVLLGVFQFQGSANAKGLLRSIQPTHLEHVIAANALNRPGTLSNGMADEFAARKNWKGWKLVHEDLEPYMAYTFGIMVFQEQVMQMYRALGKDTTPGDAATFLKVVAKGIARDVEGRQKIQQYYSKFAAGCEERGIPQEIYDDIWSQIEQMTTYAFNKSHATGYALQAYQDMWLKLRYPLEFYASLLTTEADEPKKIPAIIRESKLFGISILPPDINTSDVGFTVDGNSIRFGLLAIKQVGDKAIQVIKENRPYSSYEDFCERVPKAKCNKKVKAALFASGAFDTLGGRHEWEIDDSAEPVALLEPWTDRQKGNSEQEVVGFALSRKTEIEEYKEIIEDRAFTAAELMEAEAGSVVIGGEVANVKEITTKKGDKMAFVDVQLGTDDFSLTFFPEKYQESQHMLGIGSAILAAGEWDPERESTVVHNVCTARQLAEELKKETASAR